MPRSPKTKQQVAFRVRPSTLAHLKRRVGETGLSQTDLAERYLEEGLRLDEHPLIAFRDGAAGRRPGTGGIATGRLAGRRDREAKRLGRGGERSYTSSSRSRRCRRRCATTPSTPTRSTPGRARRRTGQTGAGELAAAAGTRRLRLLLDEHLSPQIAHQLRARSHDVQAVSELPSSVTSRPRALRTHGRRAARDPDERRLRLHAPVHAALAAGEDSYGLLLVDDRSMPRARNTIGRFIGALDELLDAHPSEDALRNQVRWLP